MLNEFVLITPFVVLKHLANPTTSLCETHELCALCVEAITQNPLH